VDAFSNIKTGLVNNPDKQLCEIIRQYTSEQIAQINQAYYETHKQSISSFATKMFKNDDCKTLTLLVLAPRHDAWAKCINIAFKDMAENSDLLVSTIIMMDPVDVYKTKVAYKIRFNTPLEKDLATVLDQQNSKGFWAKLLQAWIQRDEYGYVQARFNIKKDALNLYHATVGMGTDDQAYVDFFSKTTPEEFKKIVAEYPNTVKANTDPKKMGDAITEFYKAIDGEFSKQSLDNFAAKLAYLRLAQYEDALDFIFQNSFNEKTEYQEGQDGNIDKPMINFLLAAFRDQFQLRTA